mgnify:CR=1 FL=1
MHVSYGKIMAQECRTRERKRRASRYKMGKAGVTDLTLRFREMLSKCLNDGLVGSAVNGW